MKVLVFVLFLVAFIATGVAWQATADIWFKVDNPLAWFYFGVLAFIAAFLVRADPR